MAGQLRGWWNLRVSEKLTLLLMFASLPLISLSLGFAGYGRTRNWVERFTPVSIPRIASTTDMESAERLAQLADIAGRRGLFSSTCLRQSLLVYGLLRLRGLGPELKLGVRKQDGLFDAHAWVSLDGAELGQTDLEHSPFAWKA
jgi:hypothetical protein